MLEARNQLNRLQHVRELSGGSGVVLKRQIEPGQTVAASLQTPVLFILAENLAQMELQLDVDETDVGQVAVSLATLAPTADTGGGSRA